MLVRRNRFLWQEPWHSHVTLRPAYRPLLGIVSMHSPHLHCAQHHLELDPVQAMLQLLPDPTCSPFEILMIEPM